MLEVVSPRVVSLLDDRADLRLGSRITSKRDWSRLAESIQAAERDRIDVRIVALPYSQREAGVVLNEDSPVAPERPEVISHAIGSTDSHDLRLGLELLLQSGRAALGNRRIGMGTYRILVAAFAVLAGIFIR